MAAGLIDTYTLLTADVQPAINALPNSSGVTYEITELYYIDDTGTQVDIQRTTNSNLLNPPYGLSPIPPVNLVYYFSLPSNIIIYPTPSNVTTSVLLGAPITIGGVLLPNHLSQGFTTDVYCTVVATDTGAITTSRTEILSITV